MQNQLMLGLYDKHPRLGGRLIFDCTPFASGVTCATNEHGFADLRATITIPLPDAFFLTTQIGRPHVLLTDGASIVWEGRLEDPELFAESDEGIEIAAFGYWSSLSDVRYTALVSTTQTGDFRPITEDEVGNRVPDKFEFTTDDRVRISLQKGTLYTAGNTGELVLQSPSKSARKIKKVAFGYQQRLSNNFRGRVLSWNEGFSSGNQEWGLVGAGTGSISVGNESLTFATPKDYVSFAISTINPTGTSAETGERYFRALNIRVWTSENQPFTPFDLIIDDTGILQYARTFNARQLNESTALIVPAAYDLLDQTYEDQAPADILIDLRDKLLVTGQAWETGIWEMQRLHFRPRGSAARTWYIDAGSFRTQPTIRTLVNSAYAVYQNEAGRTIRSTTAVDPLSLQRYGIRKTEAVQVDTTDAAQAQSFRDVAVQDGRDLLPRSQYELDEVFDSRGNRWPVWYVRSGDVIVVRNLPVTLAVDIDRIRSARIGRTTYNADNDSLSIETETPLPTLDVLVARANRRQ